jgi:hypothetical protein
MALASYSISSWSFNPSAATFTVTTSSRHNMPTTSSGIASAPYAQIEIQAGTTNNVQCEGAFSLSAVPSATTFQFQRNEVTADPGCAGGKMRVAPRIILKWDSHFAHSIQSASCSGSTATLTISPGIEGPSPSAASRWQLPYYSPIVVAGVGDTRYNGNWRISSYTAFPSTTVNYQVGSCSGFSTVGAGGTMGALPNKAVKNHLIYECTGASCALPANAANFSLVGVSQGNDGYFVDKGYSISVTNVDLGDAPATAPTEAMNQYLDTTIISGGGTTSLTLANAASNRVSSGNVWHDNVPNLLQACAAIPTSGTNAVGGHIFMPMPNSIYNLFPINANFDSTGNPGQNPPPCPSGTLIDFGSGIWQNGAIIPSAGVNFTSSAGSNNCTPAFYRAGGPSLVCSEGQSFPMVYWGEQSSSNFMSNLVFKTGVPYQIGFLFDEQSNGDGTAGLVFSNVHVGGTPTSTAIMDKAGFGRFWNLGGWSNVGGDFSQGRDYVIQPLCGVGVYGPNPPAPMPYVIYTYNTYHFGTMEVDNCGLYTGSFGTDVVLSDVLTEGPAGPVFKFNMGSFGPAGMTVNRPAYADFTGGSASPYFDVVNSAVRSIEVNYPNCATGVQPVFQSNSGGSYNGIRVRHTNAGSCGGGIGLPPTAGYILDDATNNQQTVNSTQFAVQGRGEIGAGQISNPTNAPTVTVSTSCLSFPAAGTYTYGVAVWDASSVVLTGVGNSTRIGPASSSVTLDGATQCAAIAQPPLPTGSVFWGVYRVSAPAQVGFNVFAHNGSTCPSFQPVSVTTIKDEAATCGSGMPTVNKTLLQSISRAGISGNILGSTFKSIANCNSRSSPAACGTAPAGLVQVAAAATKLTIKTTAVTANSRFSFTYITTGRGCSEAPANIAALLPPYVSAITEAESFTISMPIAPIANPVCISYILQN